MNIKPSVQIPLQPKVSYMKGGWFATRVARVQVTVDGKPAVMTISKHWGEAEFVPGYPEEQRVVGLILIDAESGDSLAYGTIHQNNARVQHVASMVRSGAVEWTATDGWNEREYDGPCESNGWVRGQYRSHVWNLSGGDRGR